MESVVNQPYYSHCGAMLYATHSTALNNQDDAFLRHQAIDIYNLRPRNIDVMSKQDAIPLVQSTLATKPLKRTRGKPTNRSRTTYSKRLLVNARERERMKTLNKGFENLRNALPCYIADGHISKITTLRLAINYIKTLAEVLKETKNYNENDGHAFGNMGLLQHLNTEDLMNVYVENSGVQFEQNSQFVATATTPTAAVFAAPTTVPSDFNQALISSDMNIPTASSSGIDGEYRTKYEKN